MTESIHKRRGQLMSIKTSIYFEDRVPRLTFPTAGTPSPDSVRIRAVLARWDKDHVMHDLVADLARRAEKHYFLLGKNVLKGDSEATPEHVTTWMSDLLSLRKSMIYD